jgi:hypothetical protein
MDRRSTTASIACTPTGVSYVGIDEGFVAHQTASWTLTIPAARQGCEVHMQCQADSYKFRILVGQCNVMALKFECCIELKRTY